MFEIHIKTSYFLVTGYHVGVWLGITDMQEEKHFVAISNGRKPHYVHWSGGEPNNSGGSEDCTVYLLSRKAWNDTKCSNKAHFVFKKIKQNMRVLIKKFVIQYAKSVRVINEIMFKPILINVF